MSAGDVNVADVERWRQATMPNPPTTVFALQNKAKHVLVRLFDDKPGSLERANPAEKDQAEMRSRLVVVFSSQHKVPDAPALEPGKWVEVPLHGKAKAGRIQSMLLHVDDDKLLNGYDIFPKTAPNPNNSSELCIDSICALRPGTLASVLPSLLVKDQCVGCEAVTTARCICQTVSVCGMDCRDQAERMGTHTATQCVVAMSELLQEGAGKEERPMPTEQTAV